MRLVGSQGGVQWWMKSKAPRPQSGIGKEAMSYLSRHQARLLLGSLNTLNNFHPLFY